MTESAISRESLCVSLVGMAGAGKTTIGELLAHKLGWAHIDTDQLIEAYFGAGLQAVFDSLGREAFLQAETELVANLGAKRCVISTGGSVIYGQKAVDRLRALGPVAYLQAGVETVKARIAKNPDRGLAVAEGQTLEDLYNERAPLYDTAADFVVDTETHSPEESAALIAAWLQEKLEQAAAKG